MAETWNLRSVGGEGFEAVSDMLGELKKGLAFSACMTTDLAQVIDQ